jgi:hypothetical protein
LVAFINAKLFFGVAMTKYVEVIDIETGKVSKVSSDQIGPGMMLISYEGKEYWADSAQLRQNEYQHGPFEGETRKRIESIMNSLAGVYSLTYEEWEDGFRRDQNPLNEIAIWEYIVSLYQSYAQNISSLATKREIYKIIVTCSYSEPEQVLKLVPIKLLSESQSKEIINAYYKKFNKPTMH